MKLLSKIVTFALLTAALPLMADNQTTTFSPVHSENGIPFSLEINIAPFSLPTGLQGHVIADYQGKWVFVGGRTNGMHTFNDVGNNFPPSFQNTSVYVVDPSTGASYSRSLNDASSGLSQEVIDTLSTTAAQGFQRESKLYVVGGYGINTATGVMETKSTLAVIDLKGLINWVVHGKPSVKKSLRLVSDPYLQVTGGFLFQENEHDPFLLMLGQNFAGLYFDGSNGIYTNQIRSFWLNDDGKELSILPNPSTTTYADYRRRDLNIVPIMHDNKPAYVALAGVFTLTGGVWTVPITIRPDGSSFEPNPNNSKTFKQAMNQYDCSVFGLYSSRSNEMYAVLPGGISLGYFLNGVFTIDEEIPFINQVTTIKINKHGYYSQHLMNGEFPFIASTGSNPGNQLLFGAEAAFFPAAKIPLYRNRVIQLDKIKKPVVIGYIVGGIMSTVPNTNFASDSTASPYIFTVTLVPK